MAIHDKKNPLTIDNKGNDHAPKAGKHEEGKKEEKIGYSAQAAPLIDKEHMKRHDEAEKHDKELSAKLQAMWNKRVADEHMTN